jgi:hypothetical protein
MKNISREEHPHSVHLHCSGPQEQKAVEGFAHRFRPQVRSSDRWAQVQICGTRHRVEEKCGGTCGRDRANSVHSTLSLLSREARLSLCDLEPATFGQQVKGGMNALLAFSPPRQPGAPHLARFSRDVGYRRPPLQASGGSYNSVRPFVL